MEGKKVKVVNINNIEPKKYEDLQRYIGATGVIPDNFCITFDNDDLNMFDFRVNGNILFNLSNVKFIDEIDSNKEKCKEEPKEIILSLTQIIQQIRKIIGNEYADIKLEIWSDNSINFCIYENEIVLEIKNKNVNINTESMNRNVITYDELNEIVQIMKLIEDNIDSVLECLK